MYVDLIISFFHLDKRSPPYAKILTTISTVYINGETVEGQVLFIKRRYVGKNCHVLRRNCKMPVMLCDTTLIIHLS